MASPPKAAPPPQITNVVHSLLDGLHSMSKSETIVGEAYTLGDATIVPVHRLRVALGAGAIHGGVKDETRKGESGALGAGGTVQIEPVAVIAVGRDGVPRIMCVESETDATKKLMAQLPGMMGTIAQVLADRVGPLLGKLAKSIPAAQGASALPTAAKPLLSETGGESK